ncbi:MAG: DJ-1/PfpI family protein [Polyangiales bacterium]
MNIVCLVFEGLTALDAVGPYEVLAKLPSANFRFVAPQPGLIATDDKLLCLQVADGIDAVSEADLLLVPGGFGTRPLMRDERVLAWLRAIDRTTQLTASVCTGALLLAAAGLLRGRRANTHWALREQLAELGAIPCADRYVRDGKYATAAGVSAGIDLALALVIELAGPDVARSIQLAIEYDPRPPLDGDVERAPADLREPLKARMLARDRAFWATQR